MKYFTAKLWAGINSPRSKAASKQWDRNLEEYQHGLKLILPELNARARWFFRSISLHDGTLTRMEVGDRINDTECGWQRGDINRRQAGVRLWVLAENGGHVFKLEYTQVTHVELNFPGEALFPAGRWPNFGDWGYDELSRVRDGVFRHEVLFSSGATIAIQFAKFTFTKQHARVTGSRS